MTSATKRLYFDDSRLTTFEANVVSMSEYLGWPSVVLDRTAFYPEAGGQMADRGKLSVDGRDLEVVDVQVSDDLVVHHRVAGDTPLAPGARALGAIDRPRRLEHMALHTAQHMLSQALLLEAAAPTVSARLGETACTIDLDRPSLREPDVERAEALVNDLIDDARTIRAFFPTPQELSGLALRRAPKVARPAPQHQVKPLVATAAKVAKPVTAEARQPAVQRPTVVTETVLKATAAMPQAEPAEMRLVTRPVARPLAEMRQPVQQPAVMHQAETQQLAARPPAARALVERPKAT